MRIDLSDRCLIRVSGEDAAAFLQNIVTNDVGTGQLQYACLLTAQGQILNEFFILPDETGGFLLDVDRDAKDDLVRRLGMYKLRSKVKIEEASDYHVHAVIPNAVRDLGPKIPHCVRDGKLHADPRLNELGHRIYSKEKQEAASPEHYRDFCISLGVPSVHAMKTGKDFLADLNLDHLNAVSFDKGCFIGQELAARMHHRGLAKKRLLLVEGEGLKAADKLFQNDVEKGEIREAVGGRALALLRLDVLQQPEIPVLTAENRPVKVRLPSYMLKNS